MKYRKRFASPVLTGSVVRLIYLGAHRLQRLPKGGQYDSSVILCKRLNIPDFPAYQSCTPLHKPLPRHCRDSYVTDELLIGVKKESRVVAFHGPARPNYEGQVGYAKRTRI